MWLAPWDVFNLILQFSSNINIFWSHAVSCKYQTENKIMLFKSSFCGCNIQLHPGSIVTQI